jgi:hypothetical protein
MFGSDEHHTVCRENSPFSLVVVVCLEERDLTVAPATGVLSAPTTVPLTGSRETTWSYLRGDGVLAREKLMHDIHTPTINRNRMFIRKLVLSVG